MEEVSSGSWSALQQKKTMNVTEEFNQLEIDVLLQGQSRITH